MKKIFRIAIISVILFNSCTRTYDVSLPFSSEFAQVLEDRGYIKDAHDINISQLEKITELDLHDLRLKSIAGIEYFKSLTTLDCSYNHLISLDVSKNTNLTELDCSGNELTNLDISKNINLTRLNYAYSQLTSLDVSKNTNLTKLNCSGNNLTDLDISQNTNLTVLDCYNNQLTNLDISKNTNLTTLDCSLNPGNRSKFPIKAWFDNNSIPESFHYDNYWRYYNNTIYVDFYK